MHSGDELAEELEALSGKKIVVEGKKDINSLSKLGIHNVHPLARPLYLEIEELAEEDELVILTDLDREGKKLYSKLAGELRLRGVRIDDRFREYLLRSKISHIEGLYTYLKRRFPDLFV